MIKPENIITKPVLYGYMEYKFFKIGWKHLHMTKNERIRLFFKGCYLQKGRALK